MRLYSYKELRNRNITLPCFMSYCSSKISYFIVQSVYLLQFSVTFCVLSRMIAITVVSSRALHQTSRIKTFFWIMTSCRLISSLPLQD
jgi:hypothetical protein